MELKQYQSKVLDRVRLYLEHVAEEREEGNKKHASLDAWQNLELGDYKERQNGLGKDVPNFCLKIPTGGGKTFLAVRSIDIINTTYRKSRRGLVLWIVPTNQIYRQTLKSLRDRSHFYRQQLDIASGGHTLILEKADRFSPQDITDNLVVLMLMLPSANRQTKETLRLFKDNGGFQQFFPPEDNPELQEKLLKEVPNLDTFGKEGDFWGRQVKTSLGNTLRILNPVIILDEGHKAYSDGAQKTLLGFNPSLILELSATPQEESNKLVEVSGEALNEEEMIKLDLHLQNRSTWEWKDTLLATINKREELERKAIEHQANTGIYIRPIALIQAERVGEKQRDKGMIHAEDIREYLMNVKGIPAEHIAVKTGEKDELKIVDDAGGLLSPQAQIRYIITKSALQEGWDCPFAYVLAILTNATSRTAITQLVGRILRQPYAKKTGVAALDESYVFCFKRETSETLEEIKKGFKEEGLGDLVRHISSEAEGIDSETQRNKVIKVRDTFKKVAKQVILPIFAIKEGREWLPVNYEQDVLSRINWSEVDVMPLLKLVLSTTKDNDVEHIIGISKDPREVIREKTAQLRAEGRMEIDYLFLTRHLADIVPNPWITYSLGRQVIEELLEKNGQEAVADNFVFIVEEIKKRLIEERDRLAYKAFQDLLSTDRLRFLVVGEETGFHLPLDVTFSNTPERLLNRHNEPLQKSLFEIVPKEGFNDLERDVVWYLDDQEQLYFWYRNMVRRDYGIQGWKKDRVYPDFIITQADKNILEKVFVVETKGKHLLGNEDTEYKKSLFTLCNDIAEKKMASDLGLFGDAKLKFEIVPEEEWKRKLNELLL